MANRTINERIISVTALKTGDLVKVFYKADGSIEYKPDTHNNQNFKFERVNSFTIENYEVAATIKVTLASGELYWLPSNGFAVIKDKP